MTVTIPDSLTWLQGEETGGAWLEALPGLVAELADAWGLEVGEPFALAQVSFAAPCVRGGSDRVVLKVQWPHPECEHEAAALAAWGGRGAVELLEHDSVRHAMLLERAEPGTTLAEAGLASGDVIEAYASLLPLLLVDVDEQAPFTSLAHEAAGWRTTMEQSWIRSGRLLERRVLDAALAALEELPATAPDERVLLHQDLHPGNIVRAQRGWLAIDPKPLVGERAFALAPIVRAAETGHSRELASARLDLLSSHLGIDRDRARRWALAQTVAWGQSGDDCSRVHRAAAGWLFELGQ